MNPRSENYKGAEKRDFQPFRRETNREPPKFDKEKPKEFRKFVLIIKNDFPFVLVMEKNLLSISIISKVGLVVKFMDDTCTSHKLSSRDSIFASNFLFCGLYELCFYGKFVEDLAYKSMNIKAFLGV